MAVRMFRFTITLATGPIMRARATAIIRSIMAGCTSVVPGIMDRSIIATIAAAAIIGMADTGAAVRCTPAQDGAEISRAVIAGTVATMVTKVRDAVLDGARGAGGIEARRPKRMANQASGVNVRLPMRRRAMNL